MNEAGQTVCLCMIVKNEQHVLRRCLDSVRPLIDHWLIVDTGSTDGTQDLVRDCFKDLPGSLVERPWKNFGHNRSESLALARSHSDYLLVIDADEYLQADAGFQWPRLTCDAYDFLVDSGGITYDRIQLVRSALPWRYEGVLHEYITCDQNHSQNGMPGLKTIRLLEGARSRDPLTYRRDAALLEEALLQEPGNARYMFYLAQSYRDANEPALAIDRYRRRAGMGGFEEEVWYSLYEIARLTQASGATWPSVLQAYLKAFQYRPTRAEPLYRIGLHYQQEASFKLAKVFLGRAVSIPFRRTCSSWNPTSTASCCHWSMPWRAIGQGITRRRSQSPTACFPMKPCMPTAGNSCCVTGSSVSTRCVVRGIDSVRRDDRRPATEVPTGLPPTGYIDSMKSRTTGSFAAISDREQGLRRTLSARQLSMIAIGGAIGTGLFLGSGFAIGFAGPSVLISYLVGAFITLLLMGCMAEMTVAHPTAGSFGAWAEFYVSPLAGFLVRYAYWAGVVLAVGTEVSAVAIYMHYWFPAVPGWNWMVLFSLALVLLNVLDVRFFGSFESVPFRAQGCGDPRVSLPWHMGRRHGGDMQAQAPIRRGDRLSITTRRMAASFPNGIRGTWIAVLVSLFSYFSIEMIAVAAGEAKDPGRAITHAFRATMLRLVLFYVLTLALILAIVPWTTIASGAAGVALRHGDAPHAHPRGCGHRQLRDPCGCAVGHEQPALHHRAHAVFHLARRLRTQGLGRLTSHGVPLLCAADVDGRDCTCDLAEPQVRHERAFLIMLAISMFGPLFTWFMIFVTHLRFRTHHKHEAACLPDVGLSLHQPAWRGADGCGACHHVVCAGLSTDAPVWHSVPDPA